MESVAEPPQTRAEQLQAKQVVCPADVPAVNPAWVDEREKYLFSRGWEKDAGTGLPTYRDPKGTKLQGEVRVVGMLPHIEDDVKTEKPLRQMHVHPASYSFTLGEALDIQVRRDAAGDGGPSPLDRLGACEDRCNDLSRELETLKARVKAVITTPHITPQGMKLALEKLVGA